MEEAGRIQLAFFAAGIFTVLLVIVGVPLLIVKEALAKRWRQRRSRIPTTDRSTPS